MSTNSKKNNSADKLRALRQQLKTQGLAGFIIPRTDEFQGEYVPASAERLAWLTGFTGSAGFSIVLEDKAVVMSDGRYTLQLGEQVDAKSFETANSVDTTKAGWLKKNAKKNTKIGYDPCLHTEAEVKHFKMLSLTSDFELVPVDSNPLDKVWKNRPAPPSTEVKLFPDKIAGRTAAEKIDEIAQKLQAEGGKAVVLSSPESVCWLLNVRAQDVPRTPLALSYAVVKEDGGVDWFIDRGRIPQDVRDHLGNNVSIHVPASLESYLQSLGQRAKKEGKPVYTDEHFTPVRFKNELEKGGADVYHMDDPCILPRACKTQAEQKAIIDCHVRDGAAVTKFLKWVDDNAASGNFTELDIVDKLQSFRKRDPQWKDDSFDTISGWGAHGAIVHYKVTPESNVAITSPGLLLVDSGGQYEDGTTDITRTIAVGKPTEEMKEAFTLVLKGHIGVATAKFPAGTTGAQVDTMARMPLWQKGMDYDHGTGHGVGCYLSVHELAASISSRGKTPFKPGMLISNEPGFYKDGAFGIRTENLILVKDAGKRQKTSRNVDMLEFETVTLAPIDQRLIKPEMMTEPEINWLNDYHERVYKTLSPLMDADEKVWLKQATAPLKKNPGINPANNAANDKKGGQNKTPGLGREFPKGP